jgi:hypothetical protein
MIGDADGAVESWVYMKDGVLMIHVENDGPTFLRRGAEAVDRPVTLAELEHFPRLYAEAKALLEH